MTPTLAAKLAAVKAKRDELAAARAQELAAKEQDAENYYIKQAQDAGVTLQNKDANQVVARGHQGNDVIAVPANWWNATQLAVLDSYDPALIKDFENRLNTLANCDLGDIRQSQIRLQNLFVENTGLTTLINPAIMRMVVERSRLSAEKRFDKNASASSARAANKQKAAKIAEMLGDDFTL